MADTVITTPVAVRDSESSALGWAVALVLLLGLILFGIFIWPGVDASNTLQKTRGTNPSSVDVNIKLPEGVLPTNNTVNPNTSGSGVQMPAQSSGGAQAQ